MHIDPSWNDVWDPPAGRESLLSAGFFVGEGAGQDWLEIQEPVVIDFYLLNLNQLRPDT